MSTSFEVFPTSKKELKCDEIIEYSAKLFRDFLKRKNISYKIDITAREVTADNKVSKRPLSLVKNENCHTVFNLNEEGEVYVFYHKFTELDKTFWYEEMQRNKNAQCMQERIVANLDVGYSWDVKRTMGQPAIVSLYYGYLAIAIAGLTDGIIYSDDGAWDYSIFPIDGIAFEMKYLNWEKISDTMVKSNVNKWLGVLKNSNVGIN